MLHAIISMLPDCPHTVILEIHISSSSSQFFLFLIQYKRFPRQYLKCILPSKTWRFRKLRPNTHLWLLWPLDWRNQSLSQQGIPPWMISSTFCTHWNLSINLNSSGRDWWLEFCNHQSWVFPPHLSARRWYEIQLAHKLLRRRRRLRLWEDEPWL